MNQRLIIEFSEKKRQYFLLLCIVAALCFCQSIAAQSGRRPKKDVTPRKPPAINLPVKSEPKTDSSENNPDAKISSLLIVGESRDKGSVYSRSNYLSVVIKECVRTLNDHVKQKKSGLKVAKGEKMSFNEAIEQAKQETDTHILWIELVTKSNAYGDSMIDYIDYALLSPQTAKRLARGRIDPENKIITGQEGGVLRLPDTSRRRVLTSSQIRAGAREVINRLIRWEWL